MSRYTLYTYKNRDEFETYYKEMEEKGYIISPFIFQNTKDLLEEDTENIIDISSLVQYLLVNPADVVPAINNILPADEETRFIIIESLSDKGLEIFRNHFEDKAPLYPEKNNEFIQEVAENFNPFDRFYIYSYKNDDELKSIIEYLNDKKISLVSFSQIDEHFTTHFASKEKDIFVDITSLISAIKNNSNLIYYAEKLIIENPRFKIIVQINKVEKALEHFRLILKGVKPINEILPVVVTEIEDEISVNNVVKITDLSTQGVNELIKEVSSKLFGHKKFKDQLPSAFNNFILLNRIKEKKVFSIFLLGPTGLGKTEFATLLKNQLNPHTSMVKINFGNYSSQDALNSLIGSPRGYIGSEDGELGNKLAKSKVGIILCDEFEKANSQIFNFFLELLEDGLFTDSLSREHNIDGYIIVFTSNLDESNFYKVIPTELSSRFDLVCEFSLLTEVEKRNFVSYYVDSFLEKIKKENTLDRQFTTQEIQEFKNINVNSIENIRDIRRLVIKKILK
ncbi:AAA family ATPase [Fictibacillus sp. KIGAM418]|uniref:AAA family ATPase n=1 Tax=Fictibacillus marinisediminis TaxID=2878389 RepID=A0A9X1XGC9_9BACL|nr:AAA family ATPase [Fictibacillus marinisediminis]MCK6259415.1 AAA family ATPase [Fictibacillus marinisediminis]